MDEQVTLFLRTRRFLDRHRFDLVDSPPQGLRVLSAPGWLPSVVAPIADVVFRVRDLDGAGIRDARQAASAYWPGGLSSYAEAIATFDSPPVWHNGPAFRLLEVTPTMSGALLDVVWGTYFDAQDTSEALAYEAALGRSAGQSPPRLRNFLRDPFELRRRCALPGVNTLTIRGGSAPEFLLHSRSVTGAGSAYDALHVVPAGELQPVTVGSGPDIAQTIQREYAEELLGVDEGGEVNAEIAGAFADGSAQVSYMGIGLDPLTWKPEIYTACVWEPSVFDAVLRNRVDRTHEGLVRRAEPFDAEHLERVIQTHRIFPGAHACIVLAARHIETLLRN